MKNIKMLSFLMFLSMNSLMHTKEVELEQQNRSKFYIDISFLHEQDPAFNPKGFRQNYPVVWFMDRFISANPITSTTLVTGTAASVLAYLYYRYNHQVEKAKKLEEEEKLRQAEKKAEDDPKQADNSDEQE